jgi:hypothetical protein
LLADGVLIRASRWLGINDLVPTQVASVAGPRLLENFTRWRTDPT